MRAKLDFSFLGGWQFFTPLPERSSVFCLYLRYEPRICFGETKVSLTWGKYDAHSKVPNEFGRFFSTIGFFCAYLSSLLEGEMRSKLMFIKKFKYYLTLLLKVL